MKFLFAGILFLLWPQIGESTTYYVAETGSNSNNGSATFPWATIQYGCNNLYPGDTLLVKAGNYPEDVIINFSGTENSKIVIKPFEDDYVSLNPGSFSGWSINHLRLEGFHILSTSGETPGIEFNGMGGNIEIVGNEVSGLNASNTAAIRVGGFMHHFVIDGNHVHDNFTGNQEAIRVQNLTTDFQVINNEVHDNVNIGIDIVGSELYGKPKRGLVSRNYVHHNTLLTPFAAGIYIDEADSIVVEYNLSTHNEYGFQIACEEATGHAKGNIMRYNISYDNNRRGLNLGGYTGGDVYGCQIYNNVFVGDPIGIHFSTNPGFDNVLVNNIILSPSGMAIKYLREPPTNTEIDYNCYYTGSGEKPGSHSINENPLFRDLSTLDFRLQAESPCIDRGRFITAGLDFDSAPVPQDGDGDSLEHVDMGAYEYSPITSNQAVAEPDAKIQVFPNPNNGRFTVQSRLKPIVVRVFDANGLIVFKDKLDLMVIENRELEIPDAAAGVYILSIATQKKTYVKKVVVVD